MQRREIATILVAALVFICGCASATSTRSISPLDGAQFLELELTVGATLKPFNSVTSADWLFGRDKQRIAGFRESLRRALEARLAENGIQFADESDHALLVGIWGHWIKEPGCHSNEKAFVYLIEITAYESRACDPTQLPGTDCDVSDTQKTIGYALDSALEDGITRDVIRLLDSSWLSSQAR